jgi:biotin carboxyl carrier protein
LKVGGDVLVGLKRWETLVSKTKYVDKLLENMPDELEAALAQKSKLIGPGDLPAGFTNDQVHNALGYQGKGLEFATKQAKGEDLSPLLLAPHVLHGKKKTLPAGTQFSLLNTAGGDGKEVLQVEFQGFGTAPNGDITMDYLYEGNTVSVKMEDPDAAVAAGPGKVGPRKADKGNKFEFACAVPGEVLQYNVKPGDSLAEGEPLVVLESMKMEMKISVPPELDGMKVKALSCKARTKTDQGDILSPGDLLLELE